MDLFRLYILFSQYRSCDDTQEIWSFVLFIKKRMFMLACTLFNEQDKGSNLLSIITWSVLGKQNVQAKKVYYNTTFPSRSRPLVIKQLYISYCELENVWIFIFNCNQLRSNRTRSQLTGACLAGAIISERELKLFWLEIYSDTIFFGSGPYFVNRTQSDPGFVNSARSGQGFVNPIRSDPVVVL